MVTKVMMVMVTKVMMVMMVMVEPSAVMTSDVTSAVWHIVSTTTEMLRVFNRTEINNNHKNNCDCMYTL